jgi:hypothetical protein
MSMIYAVKGIGHALLSLMQIITPKMKMRI